MTRNLDTLIEQFNKASEVDREVRFSLEVDGVPVKMVEYWLNELSAEERHLFEAHVAKVVHGAAKMLGSERSEEWFKDIGQRIFKGMTFNSS